MPQLVSSVDTETAIRHTLINEGYDLSSRRKNGETGVDILAIKDNEAFYIEVIGFKSSAPARAKDFFEVFFRAISRIQDGAKRCVICVPDRMKLGLPQRARQYGIAWKRIGNAFPELEIWLIDTENMSYRKTKWNDWK